METNKKRWLWVDIVKGVASLSIVLAHTMSWYQLESVKYLSGWEVVVFFFVAGYLIREPKREQGFDTFVIKMLKRLILPYFILCFINLGLELLRLWIAGTPGLHQIPTWLLGIVYCEPNQMPNCTPLWFLPCLFVVRLLMELLLRQKPAAQIAIVAAALVGAELLILFSVPRLPWNIGAALFSLIFCYYGHLLRKFSLFEKLEAKPLPLRWGAILGMLVLGLLVIRTNGIRLRLHVLQVGNPLLAILGGVLCGTAVMLLCRALGRFEGNPACRLLGWVGQHTMFVVGFDFFTRTLVSDLLTAAGAHALLLMYLLRLVLLLGGCWVYTRLISRISRPGLREALSF